MSGVNTCLPIFAGGVPLRYILLVLLVMALLLTAFFSVADGDAGQKVATALEEMSLVMVLLLLHLVVSKFHGDEEKKAKKKVLSDESEPSEAGDDCAGLPGEEEPTEDEEHQQREIGNLTTKIRAAVRVGDMQGAAALMEYMQEIGGQPGHLRRACWSVSFGEIINGFVRDGDHVSAGRWLDAFARAAPLIRPSTACVNSVIVACGQKGDIAKAEAWLTRMPLIGVKIDEETYSAIIEGCVSSGEVPRAIHWLREMRRYNMRPNSELHKMVLQACANGGEQPEAGHSPASTDDRTSAEASPASRSEADASPSSCPEQSWRATPTSTPEPPWAPQDADNDSNWRAHACTKAAEETSKPAAEDMAADDSDRKGEHQPHWDPPNLEGLWAGSCGETLEVWAKAGDWSCIRWGRAGDSRRSVIMRDEAEEGAYWWGNRKYFFEVSRDRMTLYHGDDWQMRWPVSTWYKQAQPCDEGAGWTPSDERPKDVTPIKKASPPSTLRWVPKTTATEV